MGKLVDNLRLQVISLEAIENQLEELEPEFKNEIDAAIDELEAKISDAADTLSNLYEVEEEEEELKDEDEDEDA